MTAIPLRGVGGKHFEVGPQLLHLMVKALMKEPLLVDRDNVLGWFRPERGSVTLDKDPVWKRLPTIQNFPTGGMGSKNDVTILFREPVRLPPVKWSAHQQLGLTRKDTRKGVFLDGITVQPRDLERTMDTLSGEGLRRFEDRDQAFRELVGIEHRPVEAEQLVVERARALRKAVRYVRFAAALLLLRPAAEFLESDSESAWWRAGAVIVLSALSAALLAFGYRVVRYGFGAPPGGRPHRTAMPTMATVWTAGLGLTILAGRYCLCHLGLPEPLHDGSLLLPISWGYGGFVATVGMLGVRWPRMPASARAKEPFKNRTPEPAGSTDPFGNRIDQRGL